MSRPLRIEYPDAWYHVMNRDRRAEDIFSDEVEKMAICLGPQTFTDRIKEIYGAEKINRNVSSSRELLSDKQRILEVVCKSCDIEAPDILKMRLGKLNKARYVVIYLTRRIRRYTLKEIGAQFGIDSDSTVSSVMERMKQKLARDCTLSLRLDKIAGSIIKS